ncbi:hypothetical protein [Chryseobacterium taichungense]|uniref:hypothetical protein n=1 Tax=Chryseobacterium taichungense TaxID=295069 RepID=UPI0028AB1197|nr:hypothetical protein [Chryseobacterium taichungense]
MKAEISQSKLKYSDDDSLMRFANRVVFEIDPKFPDDDESNDPENMLSPLNIAINRVIDYGRRSDLTENEFMLSISMAQKGLLQIDGEKVRFFREINQAHFAQYEMGYTEFKARDQKYQNAKEEIRKAITPAEKKLTAEEYEIMTLENIRKDYHRFQADGKVLATPIFYDLIKKSKGDKIKLSFVETFLKNYVPETAEGKLSADGTSLPRVIKKDAYLEFQNEVIANYIQYLKLNETSEELWMQHWKRLREKE